MLSQVMKPSFTPSVKTLEIPEARPFKLRLTTKFGRESSGPFISFGVSDVLDSTGFLTGTRKGAKTPFFDLLHHTGPELLTRCLDFYGHSAVTTTLLERFDTLFPTSTALSESVHLFWKYPGQPLRSFDLRQEADIYQLVSTLTMANMTDDLAACEFQFTLGDTFDAAINDACSSTPLSSPTMSSFSVIPSQRAREISSLPTVPSDVELPSKLPARTSTVLPSGTLMDNSYSGQTAPSASTATVTPNARLSSVVPPSTSVGSIPRSSTSTPVVESPRFVPLRL